MSRIYSKRRINKWLTDEAAYVKKARIFIPDEFVKSPCHRHPAEARFESIPTGVHPAGGGIELTGFRLSPE